MKQFLKAGALYGVAEGVKKLAPLALLPLFINRLSPEEFGQLEYITIISTFLTLLICWGSSQGLLRLYFTSEKSGEFIFLTLLFNSVVFLVTALACFIFPIYELIGLYSSELLFLCILYSWLFSIVNVGITILRAEERVKSYASLNLVLVILQLVSIITLLEYFEFSFESKIVGNVVAYSILAFFVFYIVIRRKITWYFNLSSAQPLIKFYTPILGGNISGWFNGSIDKVIIVSLLGESVLGLYSVVMQISQVFKLGVESFLKALTVMYYKGASFRSAIDKNEIRIVSLIAALGVVFLLLYKFIIEGLIPQSYSVPILFFALAIASRVVLLLNFMQTIKVYHKSKSMPVLLINSIGGGVNCMLLYLLIPVSGLIGALYSIFFSASVMYMGYAIFNQSRKMSRIGHLVFVFLIFYSLSYLIESLIVDF